MIKDIPLFTGEVFKPEEKYTIFEITEDQFSILVQSSALVGASGNKERSGRFKDITGYDLRDGVTLFINSGNVPRGYATLRPARLPNSPAIYCWLAVTLMVGDSTRFTKIEKENLKALEDRIEWLNGKIKERESLNLDAGLVIRERRAMKWAMARIKS